MCQQGWTHLQCFACWNQRNPLLTVRDLDSAPDAYYEHISEHCCFCGKPTVSGIYVRANPLAFTPSRFKGDPTE